MCLVQVIYRYKRSNAFTEHLNCVSDASIQWIKKPVNSRVCIRMQIHFWNQCSKHLSVSETYFELVDINGNLKVAVDVQQAGASYTCSHLSLLSSWCTQNVVDLNQLSRDGKKTPYLNFNPGYISGTKFRVGTSFPSQERQLRWNRNVEIASSPWSWAVRVRERGASDESKPPCSCQSSILMSSMLPACYLNQLLARIKLSSVTPS